MSQFVLVQKPGQKTINDILKFNVNSYPDKKASTLKRY